MQNVESRPHAVAPLRIAGVSVQGVRWLPSLRNRPALITVLSILGVISGLAINALLTRDPREVGAYAVACLMIGGAMAIGQRAHHERAHHERAGHAAPAASTSPSDPLDDARREVRAVAHDLRAPLLTVSSYLELIADGAFGSIPEEARAALRRAAAVSGQAQAVVEATLRREVLEAASRPLPVLSSVDLNGTFSSVAGALTSALRERQATITVEGRLPRVLGDEAALFRVFENLVQNAIKFCPMDRQPQVGIRARRLDGAHIEVTVTDNGPGFPVRPDLLLADGVRGVSATGVSGEGLGLATVARLVTRMGGTVTFEDAPAGGTAARVTLRAV